MTVPATTHEPMPLIGISWHVPARAPDDAFTQLPLQHWPFVSHVSLS
jgi:hypothetical protein